MGAADARPELDVHVEKHHPRMPSLDSLPRSRFRPTREALNILAHQDNVSTSARTPREKSASRARSAACRIHGLISKSLGPFARRKRFINNFSKSNASRSPPRRIRISRPFSKRVEVEKDGGVVGGFVEVMRRPIGAASRGEAEGARVDLIEPG